MELESQIKELKEKYKLKIDGLKRNKTISSDNNQSTKEYKEEKECELCLELKAKLNIVQNNYDLLFIQSKESEKVRPIKLKKINK